MTFIQDCPYEMTGTAIMASRKSFSADLFACRIVSQTSPFLSPNLTAGNSVRQCRRAWAMTSLMRVDMCGQLLRYDSQSTRTSSQRKTSHSVGRTEIYRKNIGAREVRSRKRHRPHHWRRIQIYKGTFEKLFTANRKVRRKTEASVCLI